MAEALISALIEGLASMVFEGIEEDLTLLKNVERNVRKLKSNLEAIQTVLDDAERKQLAHVGIKTWLDKLNDASFDIENVIDEWNTAILRSKINDEAKEKDDRKISFSVASLFSCCASSSMKQLPLHYAISHEIKVVEETLDTIAREKDRYSLNIITAEQHDSSRPRTTSFVDGNEIKGRDEENDTLVRKLLCDDGTYEDEEFGVIPIVGMGGIGKTTLAQLAFNDEKVKAQFDMWIWVNVSDPFDEMKIAKAIIEAVEGKTPNVNELESLLQRVAKCVEGKRFLLVLDDVWTKDKTKWDQLKQPLKYGSIRSRVIVTTRKEEVAIMMGATSNMISLEMLSEENCWLIFKRLAFSERKEQERQELEDIGRRIANKCKGLPLVAKMLGSLMRFKRTKMQWKNVVNSEWWKLKDVEDIFTPFLVSYYDLSAKEKQCFLFCSIFPKDHRLSRDELIELWTSQNYFSHESRLEDEGRECFDNLVMRSFFQNFERLGFDDSITHCKMHDIVHDFAQFLTGKEFMAVKADNSGGGTLNPIDERARHLTLVVRSGAEFPTIKYNKMNKKKLRTLFVVSRHSTRLKSCLDCSLFLSLTRLRSLNLSTCWISKLPETVGKLIHLRYLDLSNNYGLVELPSALCSLNNLQTLNLLSCYLLEKLPEEIGKLVNLRNLYVHGCDRLKGFPKGFGKLARLQRLDMLFVPENEQAFLNLGELKVMRNLRLGESLYIRECRNLRSRDEAENIHLKNISQDVAYLYLHFDQLRNNQRNITAEDEIAILEGLEPHQNLVRLHVESFNGTTLSPRWMASLINLKEVELCVCKSCEKLPFLGNLPALESIRIAHMKSVKEVGLEFLGMTAREFHTHEEKGDGSVERGKDPSRSSTITLFPKLNHLMFLYMESWVRWEGQLSDNATVLVMPSLIVLRFYGCSRLQVLPEFLASTPSLKEVYADSCAPWWQKRTREGEGEEWAKISHAANIKVDGEYVRNDGEWIEAEDIIVSEVEEDDDPFDKSSWGSPSP